MPETFTQSSIRLVNEVVGYLEGCPRAHNIFSHPDGLYYYCTNEEENTLDVFDTVTLELDRAAPAHGSSEQGRLQQVQP